MTYPFPFMTKRLSSFGYESSHVLRGRVSIGHFLLGGVILFMRDIVRTLCIFSFLSPLDTLSLVHWSCDHLVIANTVFIINIYLMMLLSHFHLSLHVLFLFFLYTHISYTCMQSIISISHKDALMSFV